MEILVLDDSSGDETSRIIQSYAHAGVRFIPGRELPQGWLGKNHAYQTLANEASGDLLLYIGVDTLLAPNSVQNLVNQLLVQNKAMISVLPRREDGQRLSALFGTVRYMWELVYSRRSTPPSSGALWLIWRNKLLELDKGLSDYGLSVRPELHIAKQLQQTKDYYYLIGTRELGVRYEKHLVSQYASTMRVYYPLVGHHVLPALLATVVLGLLAAPYVLLPLFLLENNVFLALCSLGVALLSYAWFLGFTIHTYSRRWRVARVLMWPYLIVQEFVLLLHSVLRYQTRSVHWKGRNVTAQPTHHDHLTISE